MPASDRSNSPAGGAARPDAELPSEEVRGWLSLLLFVHLFAVGVALASYGQPSSIEQRLREVFGPYAGTLNFDLRPNSYPNGRFFLTHGGPSDVDFQVVVEGTLPDGSTRTETIPAPTGWPGDWRHLQALANATGTMSIAESEELQSILPRSIAGNLLRSWGATKGLVSCRAHRPLTVEQARASDAAIRDPADPRYFETVYEAHVLVAPGGQVDLVKKSAAGEVAPVEKPDPTTKGP